MSEFVVNEIVVRIGVQVKEAKDKLLTEENGRQVASLQGKVYGWRQLLENIAKEFSSIPILLLETAGQKPTDLPSLTNDEVFQVENLVDAFTASSEWTMIRGRIDDRIAELKNNLLYSAEKSRELDIAQGQRKAFSLPVEFFNEVKNLANGRRQRIEEDEKRKREELDFGDGAGATSGPTQPSAHDVVHQAGEELISSTCPNCGGTCYTGPEDNREPCEKCGGTGVVYQQASKDTRDTCPDCKGVGNVQGLDLAWGLCLTCRGSGKVDKAEPMFIVIDDSIPTKTEFLIDTLGTWTWTTDNSQALHMVQRVAEEAARQAGGRVVPFLEFVADVSVPINFETMVDDEPEAQEDADQAEE